MHRKKSVKPKCNSVSTRVKGGGGGWRCASQAAVLQLVGLHVDGVSVLLAQRFVFLGVERLALQVQMANLRSQQTVCWLHL